jgi:hypothetical protein
MGANSAAKNQTHQSKIIEHPDQQAAKDLGSEGNQGIMDTLNAAYLFDRTSSDHLIIKLRHPCDK